MVRVHLITYGDKNFENARQRLCKEANNSGWFDKVKGFSPNDLSDDFKDKYKNILKMKRIADGIWRPYIINQALNNINDDDILIYLDAGCSININGKRRFDEYINMLMDKTPIISFQTPHLEYTYTTNEIFEYFHVSNDKTITNTRQILDGILVMKKNDLLVKIIDIWGNVLEDNPLLFTDYYNSNQNAGFIDNRHEESIFSVIRKIHNPLLLGDETWFTQFGNKESLKYPFWATRKR